MYSLPWTVWVSGVSGGVHPSVSALWTWKRPVTEIPHGILWKVTVGNVLVLRLFVPQGHGSFGVWLTATSQKSSQIPLFAKHDCKQQVMEICVVLNGF